MSNQGYHFLRKPGGGYRSHQYAAHMGYKASLLICNQGRACSHVEPEKSSSLEAAVLNNQGHNIPDDYPIDMLYLEQNLEGKDTYKKITVRNLPKVRQQEGGTCVFNSIAHYLEWYVLEHHDKRVEIDVNGFLKDYETVTMVPFGYDRVFRAIRALNVCRDKGVIATSCDGQEKVRMHISGYECGSDDSFEKIKDHTVSYELHQGPLLGSFPVGKNFKSLGSGIYDVTKDKEVLGTHMVMFIGYGRAKGRPFLVFLNSYGENWGKNGQGCVYFDQVMQLEHDKGFRFIKLNVVYKPPRLATALWQLLKSHVRGFGNKKYKGPILPGLPAPELSNEPDDDEKPDPRNEISYPGQAYGDTGHSITSDKLHILWGWGPTIAKAKEEDAAKEGEPTGLTKAYSVKTYEAYQEEPPFLPTTVKDFAAKYPAWKIKHVYEMAPFSHFNTQYCSETLLHNMSKLGVEKKHGISIMSGLQKINPGDDKFRAEIHHGGLFCGLGSYRTNIDGTVDCSDYCNSDPGERISRAAAEHGRGESEEEEEDATKEDK